MPQSYQLIPADLFKPSQLNTTHMPSAAKKVEIIGQSRALEALNFGIHMTAPGYNIFCGGPKGVGRTTLSLAAVKKFAAMQTAPDDWCYIHNFETPHQPIALCFPAGTGKILAKSMKRLVDTLKTTLPLAFTDASYKAQASNIEQQYQSEKEAYFDRLQNSIPEKNVALVKTSAGVIVAPKVDGKVLEPEAFNKLPKATRKDILEQLSRAQKQIEKVLQETPKWEETQQRQLAELQIGTTLKTLGLIMMPMEQAFKQNTAIMAHLRAINEDILEHISLFTSNTDSHADERKELFDKYTVNLLTSHKASGGAPVVHLSHPTLSNLVGKIERVQESGSVMTDFSMIRPGALHTANGGFLIIECRELISNPYAWNALKRALFSKQIKIESGSDDNSVFDVISLDPAAIPLHVKIILIGDTGLYYGIVNGDDEFGELFKILAQFSEKMDRTLTTEKQYAALMLNLVKTEGLKPLSLSAMKRLVEYAARLAGDKNHLTTYLARVNDIVREASYFTTLSKARSIDTKHIESALKARKERLNSMHHEMIELINRGVISIETKGHKVGQLNALVVHETGLSSFGRPNRVTCQVRLGNGDLVDIEREVELGGPLHSKGVMILSSFLASRFSQTQPISLDASLVFEQSYTELDGDSASSVELYCLLSAVAGLPLNQGIAATGSVNQLGQVQAIGGVNEKIEGFFEVCKMNGLTGEQGVVIPATNVQNLMLSADVIAAVKQKKFRIWAVKTIDEGMEILTGKKAGVPDKKGIYPAGTMNRIVADRLAEFFKISQKVNNAKK